MVVGMENSVLAIFIAMVFISGLAFALSPISVERDMPSGAAPGEKTTVELKLSFVGEKPNGIIVTEFIPPGWEVTGSLPAATKFDGKISWVLYGDKVKNSTISYELKAPQQFESAIINGSWETLTAKGVIAGNNSVTFKEAQKQQQQAAAPKSAAAPTAPDNTLLYVGGAIILILLAIGIAFFILKKSGKETKK